MNRNALISVKKLIYFTFVKEFEYSGKHTSNLNGREDNVYLFNCYWLSINSKKKLYHVANQSHGIINRFYCLKFYIYLNLWELMLEREKKLFFLVLNLEMSRRKCFRYIKTVLCAFLFFITLVVAWSIFTF